MRRLLVVASVWLCAWLVLAGVAAPPVRPPDAVPPGLEAAFQGHAIGRGRLRSRVIGLDRGFLVWTSGRFTGDVFVLDQLFRFDDGVADRRTWRFRRSGPGRYVGERQDLAAPARARVDGGVIRLSYDIWLRRRGRPPLRLHCEDRITRLASGALLSRGTIYRLGVPVGSVETHLIPDAGRTAPPAPER